METVNNISKPGTGREFVLTRVFKAPRELVFKAWTEPDRIARWFGPRGISVKSAKMDLRPGGSLLTCMAAPDKTETWGKWVFRKIAPPAELVYINSFSDEKGGLTRHPMHSAWPLELLTTVVLKDKGGETAVTLKWLPLNATEGEASAFENAMEGMKAGWTGTFDQLEGYLVEVGSEIGPHPLDLRLTRTVEAPREKVFEAFTRAEHLVRWWAPGGLSMPLCEVDLRPGGTWRYSFRSPEGWEHSCVTVYSIVAPPRKLVMEAHVPAKDGQPIFRIRQTVILEEKGDATVVDLDVKILLANPGSEPYLAGMKEGTNQTLDNLVAYLKKSR